MMPRMALVVMGHVVTVMIAVRMAHAWVTVKSIVAIMIHAVIAVMITIRSHVIMVMAVMILMMDHVVTIMIAIMSIVMEIMIISGHLIVIPVVITIHIVARIAPHIMMIVVPIHMTAIHGKVNVMIFANVAMHVHPRIEIAEGKVRVPHAVEGIEHHHMMLRRTAINGHRVMLFKMPVAHRMPHAHAGRPGKRYRGLAGTILAGTGIALPRTL